jgi:hypothetical protein
MSWALQSHVMFMTQSNKCPVVDYLAFDQSTCWKGLCPEPDCAPREGPASTCRCLAIRPNIRGGVLAAVERYTQAPAVYDQAIAVEPDYGRERSTPRVGGACRREGRNAPLVFATVRPWGRSTWLAQLGRAAEVGRRWQNYA